MKIAFIYPDSEPASCCSWVGDEIVSLGLGESVKSHPSNLYEVVSAIRRCDASVFFGGSTQLSWLFDSAEKIASLKATGKPRMLMCGEMVLNSPLRDLYLPRFFQAIPAATHLLAFRPGDEYQSEMVPIIASGLPIMVEEGLPVASSKFHNQDGQRDRRFVFIGTQHGNQRVTILNALKANDLIDVIDVPKSNPHALVAALNRYSSTVNLRSYHDFIVKNLPRCYEGPLCGCAVLDLQKFTPHEADKAVELVRAFDFGTARQVAERQLHQIQNQFTHHFFKRVTDFLSQHGPRP